MSYREENGQVILTMSREDYGQLIYRLGKSAGIVALTAAAQKRRIESHAAFMNRLNSGNPHYTPYQVETKQANTGGK
jgi:hypothetical protein